MIEQKYSVPAVSQPRVPSIQSGATSVVSRPFPVAKYIQNAIGCVWTDEHVLTVASALVKKGWLVSRTNNEDLPTEASPMITNYRT